MPPWPPSPPQVAQKLITIADLLRSMGDYNSMLALLAGLDRGPIFRLKQTLEGVMSSKKHADQYNEMKTLTHHANSWANMRNTIKNANPPLIPYLGTPPCLDRSRPPSPPQACTSLTLFSLKRATQIGWLMVPPLPPPSAPLTQTDMINWKKCTLLAETMKKIKQYQLLGYNFTTVSQVQDKFDGATLTSLRPPDPPFSGLIALEALGTFSDDRMYELSNYLEPREGKERGDRPKLLDELQARVRPPTHPLDPHPLLGGGQETDPGGLCGAESHGRVAYPEGVLLSAQARPHHQGPEG